MTKPREKLIQVEIYGQRYSLRGSDDPSYVEKLARHVDKRMKEISEHSPTVDSLKVAVLAAVNIADEYFGLRDAHDRAEGLIAASTERISSLLDKSLEAAASPQER
jgi:cell division protein ZapA